MKKDVLIHVRGLQMMDPEEEQEPIEIVVPGQYYYRNGSHYLRYEEMMDDTAEPTVNYIKMSAKGVEVRKQGQVNVHMVFEQGKKNMTFYSTPFGTLQMGIAATGLESVSYTHLIRRELISFVRGENFPMIHSTKRIGIDKIRNPMTVMATITKRIIMNSSFCQKDVPHSKTLVQV